MNRRGALATVAGACTIAVARPARAQSTALSIATIPIDATASAWYGLELGIFSRAGLDVTIQGMSNGGAISSAVASGAVNVGCSNIVSLAQAHQHGIPFVIIAPAGLYSSKAATSVLMVPADSPIKTAKDLSGKTIAVTGLKTISQFAPMAWIDKNGGNSASVQWIEVPPASLAAALAQGRVDAAVVLEPFVTPARKTARVLANCFDAISNRFIISAYFTTRDWAVRNPDVVRRFQQVIRSSNQWANRNDDKSAVILEKYTNVSAATAETMVRATYPDGLTDALVQPVLDVAVKYGGGAPIAARDLIFQAS
jgi:NitT/TauT family transport system substrate-binding protein